MAGPAEPVTPHAIRRLLLLLVVVVLLGTGADLVLLAHYEDGWQSLPLVVIAASVPAVAGAAIDGRAVAVRILQAAMLLLAVTGLVGLWLHHAGGRAFHLEMDSSIGGVPLWLATLRAHSPPALAPASLVHAALLGLLATYRHPALAVRTPLTHHHRHHPTQERKT